MTKLTKSFYNQDTLTVAEKTIGSFLVSETPNGTVIGRINETEAYIGPIDKACHAYFYKKTERTKPLFHAGGIAYVYLIYGMYYCLNFVAEEEGTPCAVLIRGCEIIEGYEAAALNRYGKPYHQLTKAQIKNFTNGPGKLCKAFAVDKTLNYESLLGDRLFVCDSINGYQKEVGTIETSKRSNIDYAEEARDFLWRFIG